MRIISNMGKRGLHRAIVAVDLHQVMVEFELNTMSSEKQQTNHYSSINYTDYNCLLHLCRCSSCLNVWNCSFTLLTLVPIPGFIRVRDRSKVQNRVVRKYLGILLKALETKMALQRNLRRFGN